MLDRQKSPTIATHKTWLVVREAPIAAPIQSTEAPPSLELIGLCFNQMEASEIAEKAVLQDPAVPVVVFEGAKVVTVERAITRELYRYYPEPMPSLAPPAQPDGAGELPTASSAELQI